VIFAFIKQILVYAAAWNYSRRDRENRRLKSLKDSDPDTQVP
jgi:hypothetical protein